MSTSLPWIVGPIVVPLAAATLAFLIGQRHARWISHVTGLCLFASAGCLTRDVWSNGPVRHSVGGWNAPLGIDLRADGLTVVMLWMSTVVGYCVSLYAVGYFRIDSTTDDEPAEHHNHSQELFWPLWLFLWAALHALFLSADLFNMYVTLELVGLAAVALVTIASTPAALTAGIRYLVTSFAGSMAYLLGVALVYVGFGALDMATLSARLVSTPLAWTAFAFMTTGLMLKTALFPLHFWLPPAHASAPAPVSALLSALVVKASFYLLLRLWFQLFPGMIPASTRQVFGVLGTVAVLWASLVALQQQRLKLLIAYSTVAQIGYLFLLFPLTGASTWAFDAWGGGIYHAVSHACAKAAMFMAAGTIMHVYGHDRIADLGGVSQVAPYSLFAFALAGVSLMGLPPSGGFLAKWLLITASLGSGQWWWAVVLVVGGLLAAGYVFAVVRYAFIEAPEGIIPQTMAPRSLEIIPVMLALLALLLGFSAALPLALLRIGAPVFSE